MSGSCGSGGHWRSGHWEMAPLGGPRRAPACSRNQACSSALRLEYAGARAATRAPPSPHRAAAAAVRCAHGVHVSNACGAPHLSQADQCAKRLSRLQPPHRATGFCTTRAGHDTRTAVNMRARRVIDRQREVGPSGRSTGNRQLRSWGSNPAQHSEHAPRLLGKARPALGRQSSGRRHSNPSSSAGLADIPGALVSLPEAGVPSGASASGQGRPRAAGEPTCAAYSAASAAS